MQGPGHAWHMEKDAGTCLAQGPLCLAAVQTLGQTRPCLSGAVSGSLGTGRERGLLTPEHPEELNPGVWGTREPGLCSRSKPGTPAGPSLSRCFQSTSSGPAARPGPGLLQPHQERVGCGMGLAHPCFQRLALSSAQRQLLAQPAQPCEPLQTAIPSTPSPSPSGALPPKGSQHFLALLQESCNRDLSACSGPETASSTCLAQGKAMISLRESQDVQGLDCGHGGSQWQRPQTSCIYLEL